MARTLLATVAIASCAPGKPEKLERPKRIEHEPVGELRRPEFLPPPRINVRELSPPDFENELRWPLSSTSHPALEPKFDIAAQFAEPGVGWIELCSRGVQSRYGRDKDLLNYLRGWCNVLSGEIDAACSNLVPLLASTTPRVKTAVRADLANIFANGHVDKAQKLIYVHNIRDVAVLDLLAANYAEVRTADEAAAINRQAIDSDDYATAATKCIRWTKAVVLRGDKMSPLSRQVDHLATTTDPPDPTCVELSHKLKCWRDRDDCRAYHADQGVTESELNLAAAYNAWTVADHRDHWFNIYDYALGAATANANVVNSSVATDAKQVAFVAIDNAIRAEPTCDRLALVGRAKALRLLLTPSEHERLDAILTSCR